MLEYILGSKSPSIPQGFERTYFEQQGEEEVYIREGEGEPRSATSKDIEQLKLPSILGNNPTHPLYLAGDQGDSLRFEGYFPLFGFFAGGVDMHQAIDTFYQRVIRQNNEVTDETTEHKDSIVLKDRKTVQVKLGAIQQISLVTRCMLVWARGLITFCQFGILFAPFDAMANWYYRKA